jgi:poly(3-hydroxybutyrate) depolymerase
MSMITYTEQHYGGNPNQVYVTGASSGAMMTNVMLGDYPDVFKAGAAFMACRSAASSPAPSTAGTPPAPRARSR